MQKTCNNFDCAVVWGKRLQALAYNAETKRLKRKARDKDKPYWVKKAQEVFNKWIRLRDAKKPCVSCGRYHEGQYHAGHYLSVAAHPEIRFSELNVHKQCQPCNNYLSGDIANFRDRLIHRISMEKVEWIEGPHEARKYTIDDLKDIIKTYRSRIKDHNYEDNDDDKHL